MTALGPYLAACLLLVVAGLAKARRPADTARAIVALRPGTSLRSAATVVRLGAGAEAALGALALVEPRRLEAALVAASFAALAGFVAVARARGGVLATCGCFGTPDTPPTRLHVVVNVLLGGAALVVAAGPPGGALPSVLAGQPLLGAPLVAGAALLAALALAAMAQLARVQAVRAALSERPGTAP
jgi:hypothetical protein